MVANKPKQRLRALITHGSALPSCFSSEAAALRIRSRSLSQSYPREYRCPAGARLRRGHSVLMPGQTLCTSETNWLNPAHARCSGDDRPARVVPQNSGDAHGQAGDRDVRYTRRDTIPSTGMVSRKRIKFTPNATHDPDLGAHARLKSARGAAFMVAVSRLT